MRFYKNLNNTLNRIVNEEQFRGHIRIKVFKWVMFIVWLMAMVLLYTPIYYCFGEVSSDCATSVYLPVLYINLPFGAIGVVLFQFIEYVINLINYSAYTSIYYITYIAPIIYWLIMFIIGYLQWFIFIPWLYKKLSKKNSNV